jgi:putative ABC transport system ATP-binding protein
MSTAASQSAESFPVQVDQLSKSFGVGHSEVHALRGVSFSVRRGEHLAIIGPSGSGKSTLLHLVAGLTSPTRGKVFVAGCDLAGMGDRELTLFRRTHVGMGFQAFNLIPTLTVEDNLRLPMLLDGARRVEQGKVDELMEALGIADRRRHRPDQLSGGEQQRVAIGRAMVTDPTVVLADEPSGNLDTANSRRLCELMHRLCAQQQRTVVTVTHDPAVAHWADRVLVLKDGQVASTLTTADFRSPLELSAKFQEILEAGKAEACA